jgi:membrane-associated phospholipid phosphatase
MPGAIEVRAAARPAPHVRDSLRRYVAALRARDPKTVTASVLAVCLVLFLTAFARIAEDYLTGDPIVRWDVRFAIWLHDHASHPLVRLFDVITLAGNSAVLILVVLAIGIVLLRRARPNEAALLGLALGGAGLLNSLLKLAFHRPRPELAFVHLGTYSFPSGHAAVSAATFTTLAYLLGRRYPSFGARVLIAVVSVVAMLLVGFSRLYLGAHYLSDVLAGLSLGLAWASLCLLAYTIWGDRDVLALLPAWARRLLSRLGLSQTSS